LKQSGAHIAVESAPGAGTAFRVYLPLAGLHKDSAPKSSSGGPVNGSETILLVEDQPEVRRFAAEALRSFGYTVIETGDADEAIRIAREKPGEIDLLFTDVVMPGMQGPDLAHQIQAIHPLTKVLYMSGYADNSLRAGAFYVQKPFSPESAARMVREVLGPAAVRVLLVDDEPGVRKLFRQVLEGANYQVTEAHDGSEAVRLARTRSFDVVVTDLVMPEQEGIETIRQLSREHPRLKIIAVSGAFGGQYLKTAAYIGACATLSKPVSPEALLSAIRKETQKAAPV